MFDLNERGFLIDLMITWKIEGGKPLNSNELACFIATHFETNVVFEQSVNSYEFDYMLFDKNGNAFSVAMFENYDEYENVYLTMDETRKRPLTPSTWVNV